MYRSCYFFMWQVYWHISIIVLDDADADLFQTEILNIIHISRINGVILFLKLFSIIYTSMSIVILLSETSY